MFLISVNTIGKRALSQKKQSCVESFQHCSVELACKSHGREERMDVAASANGWGGQDNDCKECGRTVRGCH